MSGWETMPAAPRSLQKSAPFCGGYEVLGRPGRRRRCGQLLGWSKMFCYDSKRPAIRADGHTKVAA
jgi:hypothetical protein